MTPSDSTALTETIASTLTIELATMSESKYFCTPIEERFERITRLARRALQVPVAAVTLINGEQQWFKSICGWPVSQLPLEQSICGATITRGGLTAIGDTASDPRTRSNPFVTGSPGFRAYAGCPILDEKGMISGTFCIFDTQPRQFTPDEMEAVADLAAMAQHEFAGERAKGVHAELVSKLSVARREAMLDPLTRLWNRRGSMIMLDAAMQDARATNGPLVVALIDLDRFKEINDTLGHQVGDEVLRKCAGRLISSVRMTDIVGRIGGDEFVLILSDTDKTTARHVLNRLRSRVADTRLMTRQGSVKATISVGYTEFDPNEAIESEELLERADKALLEAKNEGRDQVKETH